MSWYSGLSCIWSTEGIEFHPWKVFLLHENDRKALGSAQALCQHPVLETREPRLTFTQRACELEEAPEPSESWPLMLGTMQKSPGDVLRVIYLQFWWNPRVALFSFGAVLPPLPSWAQVTFVSFLTFGPFVTSGSVIAIVSVVSLNNQTPSHEEAHHSYHQLLYKHSPKVHTPNCERDHGKQSQIQPRRPWRGVSLHGTVKTALETLKTPKPVILIKQDLDEKKKLCRRLIIKASPIIAKIRNHLNAHRSWKG